MLACLGSSGAVTALHPPADRAARHAGDASWTTERIITGLPYPRGAARIWRIAPGGAAEVVADGFTNIADIAFDHSGRLLVLELSRDGLPSETGALIRLDLAAGGTRTELVPGRLTSPIGLAVGPDNAIWVTNHTRVAGQGEVLRIQP